MENHDLAWVPSVERVKNSLLTHFAVTLGYTDYASLHTWSCDENATFWSHFWDFAEIIGDKGAEVVLSPTEDAAYQMANTRFFPSSKINVSENMLRNRGTGRALTFCNENGVQRFYTFDQYYAHVSSFAQFLKAQGIKEGDRVAGYIPNIPEAVIAMTATASIGAIWSSCSPDFGVQSVCDRFLQILPKILISADGYLYAGKQHCLRERIADITNRIESIEKVIIVNGLHSSFASVVEDVSLLKGDCPREYKQDSLNNTNRLDSGSWIAYGDLEHLYPPKEIVFERFDFNIPMLILFSSGTTGVPKCIVHGAGGTLLQHMKEHQLQCDIKAGDVVFYYTTCGWMMWNWLVSALASKAGIILYDGSPLHPEPGILFDLIDTLDITFFGASAKYLSALQKMHFKPKSALPTLRSIASTGSPLSPTSFEYVYETLKSDVHLMSISGGTDIVSCFFIGNAWDSVWIGELQGAGLGYKIEVFSESIEKGAIGQGLGIGVQGELVCTIPFPSQPLFFWSDYDPIRKTIASLNTKYQQAYFERYYNVWHHGDRVEKTEHGGFIIHGRSDAVLNPGGVRIGTSEIYRQVEQIPEIIESLAIGQEWQDDIRVILFVIVRDGVLLDDALVARIKTHIRIQTTPRHVPARIIQVADLPRTKNGKLAEIAARNVIHGVENTNLTVLANPESLDALRNLIPELNRC